ncbi:MAG: hypothetical protein ACP5T2_04030 [Thermoprotei archaeon]
MDEGVPYNSSFFSIILSSIIAFFCVIIVILGGFVSVVTFAVVFVSILAIIYNRFNNKSKEMIGYISKNGVYVDYNYFDGWYQALRLAYLGAAILFPLLILDFLGIFIGIGIIFGFFGGLTVANLIRMIRLRAWTADTGIRVFKKVETFREGKAILVKTSFYGRHK